MRTVDRPVVRSGYAGVNQFADCGSASTLAAEPGGRGGLRDLAPAVTTVSRAVGHRRGRARGTEMTVLARAGTVA